MLMTLAAEGRLNATRITPTSHPPNGGEWDVVRQQAVRR